MTMQIRASLLAVLLAAVVIPGGVRAEEGVIIFLHQTGTFRTNFKHMVDGAPSERVKIPIPFYIIRHPKGIVLFDTGLGEDFREQAHGWWVHRLMNLILPYQFRRSDAAAQQLKRMGIGASAISYIVVSHLHYDHAGGIRDFPEATVIVSRAEWENAAVDRWRARLRGIMKEQLEGVEKRLASTTSSSERRAAGSGLASTTSSSERRAAGSGLWIVDYQPGTALGPFYASLDLFGDGSLVLVPTPGHTPGHQSLLVTTGSGKKVFLTGDAVWTKENYEKPAPKGWMVRHLEEEEDEAWQTTLMIHQFAQEHPDLLIIPGHDPHLWPTLPKEIR